MNLFDEIKNSEKRMIADRRYFHENPEISSHEDQTIKAIAKRLEELKIDYVDVPRGGILGFVGDEKKGKTVLLRADVDALRIEEESENLKGPKVCISKNTGVCHACGHDGHIAMLLNSAELLKKHEDELNGRVILMFERGEESTHNCIVLFRYIEKHNIHIDSCYGNHVYSGLESGKVAIMDGPVMSGIISFAFNIYGRAGHGSRPDLSISPIDCFTAFYNGLESIRLRKISPFNQLTVSVGKIACGTALNIIPGSLFFAGTVRLFDLSDGDIFKKEMLKLLDSCCKAYDCSYSVDTLFGPYSPVLNDPELAKLARESASECFGAEHVCQIEPWMASESFALSQFKWPGVFSLVGITNPETGSGAAHHNGKFDIDESALKYGSASACAYAFGFLNSDIDTRERIFKGNFAEIYRLNNRREDEIAFLEDKVEYPNLEI